MTTTRRPSPARRARPASAPAPSPDDDQAPEARALLDALQAVARELRLTERRGRAPLGLPPGPAAGPPRARRRPAASLAELAERTYTDPSSASVVVQRLVERGLVMRVDSERDRRRTELRATASGRALVSRAPTDAVVRVADALSPLGGRQAAALSRGLQALARGLRSAQDGAAEGAGARE
jgi:DNA-binding MarR family transcriptional regulator